MKKIIAITLTIVCLLGLVGCNKTNGEDLTPTGYPSGQVQRQQVMYNGVIYYYAANGFDSPLPDGYELVGDVKEVDNDKEPSVDLFSVASDEFKQSLILKSDSEN